MEFEVPEAQPFEIWTNGYHFVKTNLNPVFEWSLVGTIAIAKAKFRFQIPTVHLSFTLGI